MSGAPHPARSGRWIQAKHHHAGQWEEAGRLLEENIHRYPNHTKSYKLLADVLTARATWGGTFRGMLRSRLSGIFAFDPPAEVSAFQRGARDALENSVRLSPLQTRWRAALAEAYLAEGNLEKAIEHYEAALEVAETTDHRWGLGARQKWRFQLERCYHKLGEPRVQDPLFQCEIKPTGPRESGVLQVPGFFNVRLSDTGLTVHGLLAAGDADHAEVIFNGTVVRSVNINNDSYLPHFTLFLKRRTVALLPHHCRLEVRTPGGTHLRGPAGAEHIELTVPHGNGDLLKIIRNGGQLNKKGAVMPTAPEVKRRQERDLEIYAVVRDFFECELGRSLFLIYGTLLGYHRDGDFIPGDDDFDVGYVSDKTNPVAVKDEAKDIIIALVRAGFTVSFNRNGRLFRVQLDSNEVGDCHIDVHHIWFNNGNLWAHNHLYIPASRDDFLPVVDGTLRGVRVSAPQDPEVFLRGNYGPGWKVPDPGFLYYASQVDPSVRRNLNKALLTAG
ncbi:MAG: LicD family protein, partial [bacterium]